MSTIHKIQVKKPWNGMVAVRDKQVFQAQGAHADMLILCKGKQMLIKYEDIQKSIRSRSKQPFYDKFSEDHHYLFYFAWQPDGTKQDSLNL